MTRIHWFSLNCRPCVATFPGLSAEFLNALGVVNIRIIARCRRPTTIHSPAWEPRANLEPNGFGHPTSWVKPGRIKHGNGKWEVPVYRWFPHENLNLCTMVFIATFDFQIVSSVSNQGWLDLLPHQLQQQPCNNSNRTIPIVQICANMCNYVICSTFKYTIFVYFWWSPGSFFRQPWRLRLPGNHPSAAAACDLGKAQVFPDRWKPKGALNGNLL